MNQHQLKTTTLVKTQMGRDVAEWSGVMQLIGDQGPREPFVPEHEHNDNGLRLSPGSLLTILIVAGVVLGNRKKRR